MTKCKYCGGDMVWFGSIATGFLGCSICRDDIPLREAGQLEACDAPMIEADPLEAGYKIHEGFKGYGRKLGGTFKWNPTTTSADQRSAESDEEEIP